MPILEQRDCLKLTVSHLACDAEFAGVSINMGLTDNPYDPIKPVIDTLNNLIGSLGPLKPIMDVLAVVVAVVKCVKAVPDCITSLDPSGVIMCVPDLVEKAAKLLQYLAPFSMFKFVAGIVCLLIEFLEAAIAILGAVKAAIQEILDAFAFNVTIGDDDLTALIGCGQANILSDLDNMAGLFDLITLLIEVINVFLELAGQEPIQLTFAFTPNLDLSAIDDIIAILQTADDVLRALLQIIPTGLSMVAP